MITVSLQHDLGIAHFGSDNGIGYWLVFYALEETTYAVKLSEPTDGSKGLESVEIIRWGIVKEIMSVQSWLDEEIERHLSKQQGE